MDIKSRAMACSLVIAAMILTACDGGSAQQSTNQPGTMQPQPSVQEIVQRAQQVFTSDTLKNIVITEVSAGQGPGVVRLDDPKQQVQQSSYTDQHKLWYQAPDKWRTESGSGQDDSDPTVEVSNDGSVWYYFSVGKMPGHVNIQLRENSDKQQGLRHVEERKYDIVMNLGQYYTPTLKGLDTVAGRPSYVVDSGVGKCQSDKRQGCGRVTLWFDQQTYYILKQVWHYDQVNQDFDKTITATNVQFNTPIEAATFTYQPPMGAIVEDYRPHPATAEQFQTQIAQVASHAAYPVSVPTYLPAGLVPRQPRASVMLSGYLTLDYVPQSEAAKTTDARAVGIRIDEDKVGKITDYRLATPVQKGGKVDIGGTQGWVLQSYYGKAKTPIVVLHLLRDGCIIELSSSVYPAEELIKVAVSLKAVPANHAP